MTWDDPNTLLERTTAGLTVRVAYLPIMGMATLTCATGREQVAATIEPDKALDAFTHPMLYLSPAQVSRLDLTTH